MREEIKEEIRGIADRGDVLILAHNYQTPDIYEIADIIGDSLELAIAAEKSSAETILFCGVDFMADTAKILNPKTRVLIPDPEARCTMAQMAGAQAAKNLRCAYPEAAVVSYVNTTTETKAESDICCTSANAIDIVDSCEADTVIFLPDRNLAAYTGRFTKKNIVSADGFCYVHDRITPDSVAAMQRLHPDALFIAHPECRPSIIDMAEAVCSTSGMVHFCKESPARAFIIGTESGMLHRLRQKIPDKKFFSVAGECAPMKQVSIEKVRDCLLNGTGEVTLTKERMDAARYPLEQMIQVSNRSKSRSCRTRDEIQSISR